MTDWQTVQRKTKPRIQGGSKERRVREQSRSSSRWTGPRRLDVSPNDKGSDVVRRIPSNVGCISRDVYVTCEGRVLRRSDELKSCKEAQCREQDARRRTAQRQEEQSGEEGNASSKRLEQRKGPAIQECDKDAVI